MKEDTLKFFNLMAKRTKRYADWVSTGMRDKLEPLYTFTPAYILHDSNKCEGYENLFVLTFEPIGLESTWCINERLRELFGYEPYWVLLDISNVVYLCLKTPEEVALAKLTLQHTEIKI